ncbi:MAG TPA: AAA family ATPase [Gemmatimonadaceae bacterium]|nr:AAA family ATPase [Gemmatimonadaceae bacterium]
MEEFAIRVHTAMRTGGEAVDLRMLPRPARTDDLDVHGIHVLEAHPITLFGDGGCAKSYVALFIAGELAKRGLTVLYADWELSGDDHRDRLERLFGANMPAMLYARCSRPMSAEADRLRRLVRQHNVAYLVCDSVAFACDGRPEDAEVAARYFQALRQIGVGSLNVAHTNRSEDADKKPFGSAFWHNGARATWNLKISNDARPGEIVVGAYNRKANLGPLLPAVGFRIAFSPERTHITRVDLGTVDDLAAGLPLWQRMKQAVTHHPQTLTALADELGAKTDTLDRTVRRYNKTFTRVPGVDGVSKIALVHGASA